MYIKPCPRCGRIPKIREGCRRKNGNRFYLIGCPNYCCVLKPQHNNPWDWHNKWAIEIQGNYDDNYMYRRWNEELIDAKGM